VDAHLHAGSSLTSPGAESTANRAYRRWRRARRRQRLRPGGDHDV